MGMLLNYKKDMEDFVNSKTFSLPPDMAKNFAFGFGQNGDKHVGLRYEDNGLKIVLCAEVVGTMYEGRSERIEHISVGDAVLVMRDKENTYNSKNFAVQNPKGESLGNLEKELCEPLSGIVDEGFGNIIDSEVFYVEKLSERGSRAKKAILYIKISIRLKDVVADLKDGCVVYKLGGDQHGIWAQSLEIGYCTIPLDHAKKLFEIYNRFCNEYYTIENDFHNVSYAGLEGLGAEILSARRKMKNEMDSTLSYSASDDEDESLYDFIIRLCREEPQRYGELLQYISEDHKGIYNIEKIFFDHIVDVKKYYWIDQSHVTPSEWDAYVTGFYHWYEIMELYPLHKKFPYDLDDPDTISIFGTNEFEAFADLSYGC